MLTGHFNWQSRGISPETPTYPESMSMPASSLDILGTQWIESAITSYLNLIVTLSQSQ